LSKFVQPGAQLLSLNTAAEWFGGDTMARNVLACFIFSALTAVIVARGVSNGIERWSSRFMPVLTFILVLLIIYVLTLPGAMTGLRIYVRADSWHLAEPGLLLDAMGQAFFSLSLGVGTMLVFGSYVHAGLSYRRNLDLVPRLGASGAVLDCSIAF